VTQPDVGIVIVTYNSEEQIGPCLDAARSTGAEIVVVDNASADRTCETVALRGVKLISNRVNRGFGAAVNQGIAALTSPLILLLNPDAVIEKGMEALGASLQSRDVAGAGGLLLSSDGRPQIGFMFRALPWPLALCCEVLLINRIWRRNPVNVRYRCLEINHRAPAEVEQPAGAFLMIRREVWEELGGLDESFWPLWFEDVDFCRRARNRGYRFLYVPEAVARHTGGYSVTKVPVHERQIYWYGSLLRYSRKHFSAWGARVVCAAVVVGSVIRMVAGIFIERSLRPIATYSRVSLMAGRLISLPRRSAEASSFR
jgi:hypothetical protein